MAKRFKPGGAHVELTEGDMLLVVTPLMSEVISGHERLRLTAEDIRRIQAADLLEDVPEPKTPGQRLHESLLQAQVLTEMPWSGCAQVYKDRVERAAARLGIKPEGE